MQFFTSDKKKHLLSIIDNFILIVILLTCLKNFKSSMYIMNILNVEFVVMLKK